jgi:hypothetical protein
VKPALFTTMSGGSAALVAWAKAASTEARSETSIATLPPSFEISSTSDWSRSVRRAATITLAPDAASIARERPRELELVHDRARF